MRDVWSDPIAQFHARYGNGELNGPFAWIDDHRLIANFATGSTGNSNANSFAVMRFSADYKHLSSTTLLIPLGDRSNFDPVVSPDHSEIAFPSVRGQSRAIFLAPVDGSAAARQLVIWDGAALIDWR